MRIGSHDDISGLGKSRRNILVLGFLCLAIKYAAQDRIQLDPD